MVPSFCSFQVNYSSGFGQTESTSQAKLTSQRVVSSVRSGCNCVLFKWSEFDNLFLTTAQKLLWANVAKLLNNTRILPSAPPTSRSPAVRRKPRAITNAFGSLNHKGYLVLPCQTRRSLFSLWWTRGFVILNRHASTAVKCTLVLKSYCFMHELLCINNLTHMQKHRSIPVFSPRQRQLKTQCS